MSHDRDIKPAKSVGDWWLLCREPQAFAIKLKRDFKIDVVTVQVRGGEYLHIPKEKMSDRLWMNLKDPKFRQEHGIVNIHPEQPVKAFGVGTGE